MKLTLSKAVASALGVFLIGPALQAQTVTPVQWLDSQPQPAFKAGHTLPRLTRYGWSALPVPMRIKMCENWGYALDFTRYAITPEVVSRLDNPSSEESQMAALNASNPQRYPLTVTSNQRFPGAEAPYASWTRDVNGVILQGNAQSADGTAWGQGNGPLFSLEAPNLTWEQAGELHWGGLRTLRERGIPVSIVLNGAESGFGIPGFATNAWNLDPTIQAAVGSSPWGQGNLVNHAAAKMANSMKIIADAARTAMPQQDLYVYYTAGGRSNRNTEFNSDEWSTKWEHTRGTGLLPTGETYYRHFRGDFVLPSPKGPDMLTGVLNGKSLEIATGDPLSYHWISGGWDRGSDYIADHDRWAGFLKCCYTAGVIGTNTGHYGGVAGDPYAFFNLSFPASAPPYWLKQLTISSHIHALFTQVESIVRNSDLLPGPALHKTSRLEPAYEFPTGDDTARVLARKHRTNASWLIAAWAADGANRNVSVYIPELGQLTVEARNVGSVYTAALSNGQVTLTRIDNEGATYSAVANGTPVVSAVNLALPLPPAAERLVWLSADSGVTADAAGKVSGWINQGSVPLTLGQGNAARRPTLVANAVNGKPAIRVANGQTWLENMSLGVSGDAFIGPITTYAVFTGASVGGRGAVVMGVVLNGNPFAAGQGFVIANDIPQDSQRIQISDGVAMATTPNASVNTRLTSLTIGETNTPGQTFGHTGDIAEVLVYKGQSHLTRAQIQLYLSQKYNIKPNTSLANASFEGPAVTGYAYNPLYQTGPAEQQFGWLFANHAAVQANGSAFAAPTAPNGNQTGVLQGTGNKFGCLSQTVNFAAGTYTLSFKAARRAGQIQPIRVSLGSKQIGDLITPASDAFADYTTVSFPVSSGLHVLRLEATDGAGNKSTFIDQVALTKVAAPATLQGGSFEAPSVSALTNKFQYSPIGSGWTYIGTAGIQANGSVWGAASAPEGVQTAIFQQLGGISQTLTFAAGSYTIGFKAARRGSQIQPVRVSIDGTQVGGLITPTSSSFGDYTSSSFTVTAGVHTIRLEGTDGTGDKSTFIDQVVLTPATVVTPIVAGSSFETPAVSGYQYAPTGSGWTFDGSSAIQANGSAFGAANAPTGTQTAALQGLGAISQSINFAAGSYTVSFQSARRTTGGIQTLKVSIDGTQVGGLITPASTAFAVYTTAAFTVTSGAHVLRIEGTNSVGDNTAFVDDVSINPASLLIAGHIYKVTAKHSGKALEVAGSSQADSANVQQWAYSSGLQQQWMAEDAGSGAWRLTPQHSLKSLDVAGASTADGANVDQFTYAATDNQKWFVDSVGGGYAKIIAKHSGKGLDVEYVSMADGGNVGHYGYGGGDNQKWLFTDLSLGSANMDIGTVNPAGTGILSGAGIYTITGSGLGITGTADKGHLYYDKLTGDGSIIAKVLTVQNTNASAKAGIMIRETTATGSKNVFLAFTPNGTVNFQRRTALDGTTTNTTVVTAIPSWVKLTRVGNTFTAHRSTDGIAWTAVGSAVTVSMTSDVLIGLAVTSNTAASACTATFRNVTLTGNITRLD